MENTGISTSFMILEISVIYHIKTLYQSSDFFNYRLRANILSMKVCLHFQQPKKNAFNYLQQRSNAAGKQV